MLSSIHPLGERARHNRWALTVTAMVGGAVAAGGVLGGLLGALGSLLADGSWRWPLAAVVVAGAGIADLARIRPPGPRRQVDEDWIGAFRGWVYGGAFGVQLGAGAATFVVTWGVWAAAALAVLTAGPFPGALIGAAFGLGRTLASVAAGWIDRPSRLTVFSRSMATAATPVARGVAIVFVALGLFVAVGIVAAFASVGGPA